MSREILTFDCKDRFEESVKDHLDEISRICTELQIPYYFCACISNVHNKDGSYSAEYCRAGRTPASFGGRIPDDEVSKHYSVSLGAIVVHGRLEDVSVPVSDAETFTADYEAELID